MCECPMLVQFLVLTTALPLASGWGNFMSDMIFNAQLVYMTGRS